MIDDDDRERYRAWFAIALLVLALAGARWLISSPDPCAADDPAECGAPEGGSGSFRGTPL